MNQENHRWKMNEESDTIKVYCKIECPSCTEYDVDSDTADMSMNDHSRVTGEI